MAEPLGQEAVGSYTSIERMYGFVSKSHASAEFPAQDASVKSTKRPAWIVWYAPSSKSGRRFCRHPAHRKRKAAGRATKNECDSPRVAFSVIAPFVTPHDRLGSRRFRARAGVAGVAGNRAAASMPSAVLCSMTYFDQVAARRRASRPAAVESASGSSDRAVLIRPRVGRFVWIVPGIVEDHRLRRTRRRSVPTCGCRPRIHACARIELRPVRVGERDEAAGLRHRLPHRCRCLASPEPLPAPVRRGAAAGRMQLPYRPRS